MHTVRVFYDMYDEIKDDISNNAKRKLIHRLDKELLSPPHSKKTFSIGYEVSERQQLYTGVASEPLHPGITSEGFYCEDFDYIYMPGRLHKWKRVDLVIKAMKYVSSPVKLKIVGTGDDLERLKRLAKADNRIEFLGYVDDFEMRKLYANALAVTFVPCREDYGYILHEAFKSKKPVITTTDSGEPARFIDSGINGFLVSPDPEEIAKVIDLLFYDKKLAATMGNNGFESIKNITWDNVVQKLLKTLEE